MRAVLSTAIVLAAAASVTASPLACNAKNWDSFTAHQFLNWLTGQPYTVTWGTVEALCPSGSTSFTFNVVDPATCTQFADPTWYPQYDLYKNVTGGTQFIDNGLNSEAGPLTGRCVKGGYVDLTATWNLNMTEPGRPKTAYTLIFA